METFNKTKSASQILNDAADLLEQTDRWNKGHLFKTNTSNPEKGCSMCAHGAIIYCSDVRTKERIDNNIDNISVINIGARSNAEDIASSRARRKKHLSKTGLSIEQYFLTNYGEFALAHYKAFRVGLWYEFNDSDSTTKQQVIDKLREAAQLTTESSAQSV